MNHGVLSGIMPIFTVAILVALLTGCSLINRSEPDIRGQWTLTSVDGEPLTASEAPRPGKTGFTLNLSDSGSASGKAACNTWRASYSRQGNALTMSQLVTTRAFCLLNDRLKAIESDFPGALRNATISDISEQELTLVTQSGHTWVFSR
ncbi:MAG: META domain-containing protein [Ketobacteraceae bacterium]|nr:META domain-containing protein [Ketobacteraceae bacterium]